MSLEEKVKELEQKNSSLEQQLKDSRALLGVAGKRIEVLEEEM